MISRNGTQSSRPHIDRAVSTLDSTPVATSSVVNKLGSASSSLYQNCRTVLERLYRVPGFAEAFIDPLGADGETAGLLDDPTSAGVISSDPVSRCLHTLRLGSSLCFLFNALGLDSILEVNPDATMTNLKACQKGTAYFIMACQRDLHWGDQDVFAIRELYGQDTNGVVKVINTVTKLLDKLEEQGVLDAAPEALPSELLPTGPSDLRTKVVDEILSGERKYVQDLEVLQDYQRQVQANDVITQDQVHNLFLNLNALADFARRFLIGVEANASQLPENQRFGHLFLQMEDHFSVYEPYCANLTAAQDLAIAENAALSQLSHVLDPISELAFTLIKPVQRIMRYPLLLESLVKHSDPKMPYYIELQDGYASSKRVVDRVNETTRREGNRQAVVDLGRRVEDWKGHDITTFGELLLQETFFVIKNDSEREYNVYLFERIILCCKESGSSGKKSSKSNSILKKPATRKPTNLQLKGRIFVNNVTGAQSVNRNGQCLLEVRWRGDVAEEAFTIKCRTEELLRQWQRTIMKAVDESPNRRRAHHLSASRRERGANSPLSQFPATPLSESGPSVGGAYYPSQSTSSSDPNSYPHANSAQPSYPPDSNGFDDEDNDHEGYNESGRSTPSTIPRRGLGSTRSLHSNDRDGNGFGMTRPRAQTEDSSSSAIYNWRNQTPNDSTQTTLPGLPRGVSITSNGSDSISLRSSASSRQLRHKPSAEWTSTSPALGFSRLQTNGQYDDDSTPRPNNMPRQSSHTTVATSYAAAPLIRNRSASSPNIYQLPAPGSASLSQVEWSPHPDQNSAHPGTAASNSPYIPSVPTLSKGNATDSGGTLASASSRSGAKRSSSSSNGTDRSSGASSQSQGQTYTATTSPANTLAGTQSHSAASNGARGYSSGSSRLSNSNIPPPVAAASAIRVKVTYGDDTFVVVVLSSVSHRELFSKVLKKIRLCGDRSKVDDTSLRLRYEDEDGDRILITSGEDVAMAVEAARSTDGITQTLALFATVDLAA